MSRPSKRDPLQPRVPGCTRKTRHCDGGQGTHSADKPSRRGPSNHLALPLHSAEKPASPTGRSPPSSRLAKHHDNLVLFLPPFGRAARARRPGHRSLACWGAAPPSPPTPFRRQTLRERQTAPLLSRRHAARPRHLHWVGSSRPATRLELQVELLRNHHDCFGVRSLNIPGGQSCPHSCS